MNILPLDSHIWVSASAGTGKTTILTRRVLQLLLSGATPTSILCLTYTNAAAAEMKQRVLEQLGQWVIADEKDLKEQLSIITTHITDDTIKHARGLFFDISENPDSLNIQTIHGFCQSILRKFPMEAGVSPYFTVIDEEQSQSIMEQSFEQLLYEIHQGKHPELQLTIEELVLQITDYTFRNFITTAINENGRWRAWLNQPEGLDGCKKKLEAFLEIQNDTPKPDKKELKQIASYFAAQEHKTLTHLATEIEALLSLVDITEQDIEDYCHAWLTDKNTLRQPIEKSMDHADNLNTVIRKEANRVLYYRQHQAHLHSYELTANIYTVLQAVLEKYESICESQGYLDYHHLLHKTEIFLKEDETALGWVMFKLDGGIDHVLVDEAQDTNPLQWDIIKAITAEYFSGKSRKEHHRTLFIVGDEKQSIFGFQDADLDVYRGIKSWLESSAKHARQPFFEYDLTKSYRSTPQIIEAVNVMTDKLGYHSQHIANRTDKGQVTLWPIATASEDDEKIYSPSATLAMQIAAEIKHWLTSKKQIATTGQTVKPEDIMILVRRRSDLSVQLASELRSLDIPVQGVERLVLRDNLAVQDILALMQWLLLPIDDYSLACVLRSPLLGISEEQLFKLSAKRGEHTLWESLQSKAEALGLASEHELLKALQQNIIEQGVSTFLYSIYYQHKLANHFIKRMGQEVMIPLHALLEKAKQFEIGHPHNFQLFIEHIKEQQHEIINKDAIEGCVRIMTIHGSKGLEAPIVILADTTHTQSNISGFDWIPSGQDNIPCWLPPKIARKESLTQILDHAQNKLDEEDKRLLYVAMTRARDELYITGPERRKTASNSWYDLLSDHLKGQADFSNFAKSEKNAAVA